MTGATCETAMRDTGPGTGGRRGARGRKVLLSVVLSGLVALAGVFAPARPAAADIDYSRFWPAALAGFAVPASDALVQTMPALATGIEIACTGGSSEPFAEAFSGTVAAAARLSVLRAGALADDNRLERIAFIPDGRGVVRRQVTRLIAERDPTALDAARLREKSVALQGLTALEWAAFDKDGQIVLADRGEEAAYRCAYAASLAERLGATAREVRAAFETPSGQAALLRAPGPDNALARTHKEAAGFVFNAVTTSLELIRDQMLVPLVGEQGSAAGVPRVPFSRSHNGTTYLAGAIDGLFRVVAAAGYADGTAETVWIGNALRFERDNASRALAALPADLRAAMADETARGRLAYVLTVLTGLRTMLSGELAGHLGFRGGFNALDGD